MKKATLSLVVLAATLMAGQSFAQDKSRAQVRAELEEARHNGTLVVNGETGQTAREQRPDLYPKVEFKGKTRAEVRAELEEARRMGTLVVDSETGQTAREQRPDLYPKAESKGKTRAEVLAELDEAVRNGTLVRQGD